MTFGKVMGGGFPAAAFGGRHDLMQHLAPVGGVYQAGTLSGNPVATAAGLTALALADDEAYVRLDRTAATVRDEVHAALSAAGVAHVIQAVGNLFSVLLRKRGRDRRAGLRHRGAAADRRYAAFFHAMLESGVYLPPSAYEGWFSRPPMTTGRSTGSWQALPGAATAAARVSE